MTTIDDKYKVEIVDNSEFTGFRKGRWKDLLYSIKSQIKNVPSGRSIRVKFTEPKEISSFQLAARAALVGWKYKDYYVGTSKPEIAVYIGKK